MAQLSLLLVCMGLTSPSCLKRVFSHSGRSFSFVLQHLFAFGSFGLSLTRSTGHGCMPQRRYNALSQALVYPHIPCPNQHRAVIVAVLHRMPYDPASSLVSIHTQNKSNCAYNFCDCDHFPFAGLLISSGAPPLHTPIYSDQCLPCIYLALRPRTPSNSIFHAN